MGHSELVVFPEEDEGLVRVVDLEQVQIRLVIVRQLEAVVPHHRLLAWLIVIVLDVCVKIILKGVRHFSDLFKVGITSQVVIESKYNRAANIFYLIIITIVKGTENKHAVTRKVGD